MRPRRRLVRPPAPLTLPSVLLVFLRLHHPQLLFLRQTCLVQQSDLLHDISKLSLVQFSISFALLTHLNQHWDDLLPDNLRARGVQIWEEVLHRGSAVGHEWGNVSIWPSPAILPFVLLVPNSPAAPSSTVVPV